MMYTGINGGFTLFVNFLFLKNYFRAMYDVPFSRQHAAIIRECIGISSDFLQRPLSSRKTGRQPYYSANHHLFVQKQRSIGCSLIRKGKDRRSGPLCSGKDILTYPDSGLLKKSFHTSSCRPPPHHVIL